MKLQHYTTLPGLSIVRAGGNEMELFAENASENLLTGFAQVAHREAYGEMLFQYYIGDGFQLWHSRYAMNKKITVLSKGDVSLLELHIPLQGDAMSWWDGQRDNALRKGQFDLGFTPFVNSATTFEAGNICETLDIHYSENFLKTFAASYPALNDFLEAVEKKERASLLQRAVRMMSPAMMKVVRDIMRYPGTTEFADAYYLQQASILLEMVLQRAMNMNADYSSKKYLDAALAVAHLLSSDPCRQHTGQQLSAHTGVSLSLLHKCFKDIHGATLFDFGQGVRLDFAKQLLLGTSLTLQEIGERCGYADRPNFTIAFTRRFGFSPMQFRQFNVGRK